MNHIDPRIAEVLRCGLEREGWDRGRAKARALDSDRGGLTRGGITAVSWGEFRHLGRPATAGELDAITETEALEFYYQRHVVLPRFDQVLDQKLRALLVDWSFTSWFDDPVKAVQSSLRARGLYADAVDGAMGPKTIAALQADRDPRQLFRDVYNARIRFYLDLAFAGAEVTAFLKAHPASQLHNARGWAFRCLDFTP